ncbi:hypothetical protein NUACC21_58220 [Scytonema sp. NUACC21]
MSKLLLSILVRFVETLNAIATGVNAFDESAIAEGVNAIKLLAINTTNKNVKYCLILVRNFMIFIDSTLSITYFHSFYKNARTVKTVKTVKKPAHKTLF